ncbi:calcium-dependent protein kinase 24 [Cajanus cajan]|uniref:non-specific serine/threonine protein kinase n=1 Tax=Cajanus cajan TaxID=3821 RepID=A0A151RUT2_CAJCA|nr:calcium-dependent protein kinase 24 [Cajanus cajan]KYP46292.1 Calcium-dependent protein kinase 24 [Cajanus cajan]
MGSCVSSQGGKRKRAAKQPYKTATPKGYEAARRSSVVAARRSSVTVRPPVNVVADPSPGNIFDKYSFGKELGRGEFGVTHRVVNVESGEAFACKKIAKTKLRTEIDVQDVRREVQIMKHLPQHPNIVAFKEAYEDKDAVYLVMELCEGGELFDRIVAKGHYTERAAANVTKTILDVCKVCHEYGVIHRDLKPENFLFTDGSESASLKSIDFGLSTFYVEGERFSEIVGSPYYMAPEVLRRNYGPEIDVWSTGVILYILLCGVPPFWAESEEGIAQAIIRGKVDFTRDPWPKVSDEAKHLVKRMLDPNPFTRIKVQEVLDHSWIQHREHGRTISLGDQVRMRIKQFSLMNRFKKKVLRVVADNLPDEQIDVIKKMFDMMDKDKNGNLSFDELKDGLSMIGHALPDTDVQMLMDAADIDGNGTLNYEEFITMNVHLRKIESDEHLSEAFRYFDKNQSGYVEFEELKDALSDDDSEASNDQVIKDILNDVDLDKDGRISFEEFKAMMKTGGDWKMASRQYSRALLNALSFKMFKDTSNKTVDLSSKSFKFN